MARFAYNDIVRIKCGAEPGLQHGRAWIVGVFEERFGPYFDTFPAGPAYTVEFEDGSSAQVHEASLEPEPSDLAADSPAVPVGEVVSLEDWRHCFLSPKVGRP